MLQSPPPPKVKCQKLLLVVVGVMMPKGTKDAGFMITGPCFRLLSSLDKHMIL